MARLLLFLLLISSYVFPHELRVCLEGSSCVAFRECRPTTNDNILYPCHNGLNLICCPTEFVVNNLTTLENRKTSLFPVDCGVISNENKITGGKTAALGQFPWMVLLGYRQRSLTFTEFLCGGTVITDRFVLTAAHCIGMDQKRELVLVRLGENNLQTEIDCIVYGKTEVCADRYVEVAVERSFQHESYNSVTLKNDIGLVKVATTIPTTEYIRPICLPFERNIQTTDLTGRKFTISGWGKTNSKNVGGSNTLQYATVTVWIQSRCNSILPISARNISDTQLCGIGKIEDACRGDSGGPMINSTVGFDGEIRNFQIGIVSFAPTMVCGIEELPPVYTRVDKFLNWITDSINKLS